MEKNIVPTIKVQRNPLAASASLCPGRLGRPSQARSLQGRAREGRADRARRPFVEHVCVPQNTWVWCVECVCERSGVVWWGSVRAHGSAPPAMHKAYNPLVVFKTHPPEVSQEWCGTLDKMCLCFLDAFHGDAFAPKRFFVNEFPKAVFWTPLGPHVLISIMFCCKPMSRN